MRNLAFYGSSSNCSLSLHSTPFRRFSHGRATPRMLLPCHPIPSHPTPLDPVWLWSFLYRLQLRAPSFLFLSSVLTLSLSFIVWSYEETGSQSIHTVSKSGQNITFQIDAYGYFQKHQHPISIFVTNRDRSAVGKRASNASCSPSAASSCQSRPPRRVPLSYGGSTNRSQAWKSGAILSSPEYQNDQRARYIYDDYDQKWFGKNSGNRAGTSKWHQFKKSSFSSRVPLKEDSKRRRSIPECCGVIFPAHPFLPFCGGFYAPPSLFLSSSRMHRVHVPELAHRT